MAWLLVSTRTDRRIGTPLGGRQKAWHGDLVLQNRSTKKEKWAKGTGTAIWYNEDGSKSYESPYVDGKQHGTAIDYNEDGSKHSEIVFENGEFISRKDF